MVTIILVFVDFIFLIPYVGGQFGESGAYVCASVFSYLILLMSLIREKNAKVKEILKVLGIEPILNNFAQAMR